MPNFSNLVKLLLASLLLALAGPTLISARQVKVGEPMPDFALSSVEGKNIVRLSDYRGRRVLVFTWASW